MNPIEILISTLHDFYRQDRDNKIELWNEKMHKLRELHPNIEWMKMFSANIDIIKAGEKKLSLNKKLKKIKK